MADGRLRRLLNYTPQGTISLSVNEFFLTSKATLVRLLTINSMNAYITSWVLYLSGGSEDPRLLLPAWISIATVSSQVTLFGCSIPNPWTDFDFLVPCYTPSISDSKRNFSFHIRVLYSKLHKHG